MNVDRVCLVGHVRLLFSVNDSHYLNVFRTLARPAKADAVLVIERMLCCRPVADQFFQPIAG